jgi:hypothetical protein
MVKFCYAECHYDEWRGTNIMKQLYQKNILTKSIKLEPYLASIGSTAVEQLLHHPKVKSSILAVAAWENGNGKKC